MISLRLSESEYTALVDMTASQGVRSTSELARTAICDYLANHRPGDDRTGMQRRIEELESEVRRLSRILESFATLAKERD
jgi:metal-responsive CopG/Arc/MetJ family transcriptional regulator